MCIHVQTDNFTPAIEISMSILHTPMGTKLTKVQS